MPNLRIFLVAISLACLTTNSCRAGDVFQDLWGIATDPLKLDKSSRELSETAQRILIQLKELEGVTNAHVQERLEQLRSIISDALSGADSVVQRAIASARDLEAQINADANRLLYKIKCAADVTLMSTAQKSFAGLISTLGKADPSIRFLGIKIIDIKTNEVEITDPDKAYLSTKDAVITNLQKSTNDTSQAYSILSAYQNLEVAAKFCRCYYQGQASEIIWTTEVNEWERRSLPWLLVVRPVIDFKP